MNGAELREFQLLSHSQSEIQPFNNQWVAFTPKKSVRYAIFLQSNICLWI